VADTSLCLQAGMGNSCDLWKSLLSGTGGGAPAAAQGLGSLLPQPSTGDGTKNGSGQALH